MNFLKVEFLKNQISGFLTFRSRNRKLGLSLELYSSQFSTKWHVSKLSITFHSRVISITKIEKKMKFMRKSTKNCIFSIFVTLRTFEGKVIESSEASHFVENWLLCNSRLLKQVFCCAFWMLKNQSYGFLETLF